MKMNDGETVRKLSEITDDAAFERLATAVLREAKPEYAAHSYTRALMRTAKRSSHQLTELPSYQTHNRPA